MHMSARCLTVGQPASGKNNDRVGIMRHDANPAPGPQAAWESLDPDMRSRKALLTSQSGKGVRICD
jgi:hypothetical protein